MSINGALFHRNEQVNTYNVGWVKTLTTCMQNIAWYESDRWCGFTAAFIIGPFFLKKWQHNDLSHIILMRTSILTCYRLASLLLSSNEGTYKKLYSWKMEPTRHRNYCPTIIEWVVYDASADVSQHLSRWPDLTPCDFWLWRFLKGNIYRDLMETQIRFKEQYSPLYSEYPFWLSPFIGRKHNF